MAHFQLLKRFKRLSDNCCTSLRGTSPFYFALRIHILGVKNFIHRLSTCHFKVLRLYPQEHLDGGDDFVKARSKGEGDIALDQEGRVQVVYPVVCIVLFGGIVNRRSGVMSRLEGEIHYIPFVSYISKTPLPKSMEQLMPPCRNKGYRKTKIESWKCTGILGDVNQITWTQPPYGSSVRHDMFHGNR